MTAGVTPKPRIGCCARIRNRIGSRRFPSTSPSHPAVPPTRRVASDASVARTARRQVAVLFFANLILFAVLATPGVRAPQPTIPAIAFDEATVSEWIELATEPDNTPSRSAARDALFRRAYPRLIAEGVPPSADEVMAMTLAARSVACAGGTVEVRRAVVKGDLAYVSAASREGACSWLLSRDGARWLPLMPLGWTLHD